MTTEDIEKELNGLSWNSLQTYCKDTDINIKGLKKEEVIQLALKKRITDLETLKSMESTVEEEEDSKKRISLIKIVTVQNLNPNETKLPSKVITIGNMKDGFVLPSYVVQFGRRQRLPQGIIWHLQNQTFRTSKNIRNEQGEHNTINIEKPHYQVVIHPN